MALASFTFRFKDGLAFHFHSIFNFNPFIQLLYKRMNFFYFCPDKLLFSKKSSNNVGFVLGEKKLFSSPAYLWTSYTLLIFFVYNLATMLSNSFRIENIQKQKSQIITVESAYLTSCEMIIDLTVDKLDDNCVNTCSYERFFVF